MKKRFDESFWFRTLILVLYLLLSYIDDAVIKERRKAFSERCHADDKCKNWVVLK